MMFTGVLQARGSVYICLAAGVCTPNQHMDLGKKRSRSDREAPIADIFALKALALYHSAIFSLHLILNISVALLAGQRS